MSLTPISNAAPALDCGNDTRRAARGSIGRRAATAFLEVPGTPFNLMNQGSVFTSDVIVAPGFDAVRIHVVMDCVVGDGGHLLVDIIQVDPETFVAYNAQALRLADSGPVASPAAGVGVVGNFIPIGGAPAGICPLWLFRLRFQQVLDDPSNCAVLSVKLWFGRGF